jgi:hypothetical protein
VQAARVVERDDADTVRDRPATGSGQRSPRAVEAAATDDGGVPPPPDSHCRRPAHDREGRSARAPGGVRPCVSGGLRSALGPAVVGGGRARNAEAGASALSRRNPRTVPSRHSDTRRGPFGCRVTGRGSAGPGPVFLRVWSCRMRRPWGCRRPGGGFLPVSVCWALSCPVPDIPGRRYRPFRGGPVAGRCARHPIVDAAAGGTGGIEGGIPCVSFGRQLLP